MPEIFINYRTGDGEQAATTIERDLSRRFGEGLVFRASKSIKPGQSFPDELLTGVRRCSALLAVMGPGWLDTPDSRRPDRRALDNENDWVRKEILEAFSCALPVIPVLVGRLTGRLDSSRLPRPLARLAYLQSMRFDTHQAASDLAGIGDALVDLVPGLEELQGPSTDLGQGSVDNTITGGGDGSRFQARDVSGTVIQHSNGPVNTGEGTQHNHQQHVTGDGATFITGGSQGEVTHRWGSAREREGGQ